MTLALPDVETLMAMTRSPHRMEREPQVVVVPVIVMEHNTGKRICQTEVRFGLASDCRVVNFDVLGKV